MSFLDKVKNELKKAIDDSVTAVKGGAKIAAEKSEELAKDVAEKGKHKYQTFKLHRDADKLFSKLGGMVYDLAKPPYENPLSNDEVRALVDEIKNMENEISKIEKEEQEESSETEEKKED